MKLLPKGNRVLITGGAKGFGKALAMLFAQHQWRICLADLREADLYETQQVLMAEGASEVVCVCANISDMQDITRMHDTCVQKWQGLDVLVNNAGIYCGGLFADMTEANWGPVIDTNLIGTLRMTQAFIPLFKKQKSGRVVNIASLSGVLPMPGSAAYAATKGAICALSQGLRHELRPYRIGVTLAIPNVFKTDIFKDGDIPNAAIRASLESTMHMSPTSAEQIAQKVFDAIMNDDYLVTTDESGAIAQYLDMMNQVLAGLTQTMSPLSNSMKNKSGKNKKKALV